MRIAVLGSTESWYLRDLRRAASDRHDVVPVTFRALSSAVGNGVTVHSKGADLDTCDRVLIRTMPAGSLEQVVFRMDALGQLAAWGVPVINPPRAIEVAVDKYLATARLQAAELTVPPTAVCQTVDDAMESFHELGGDIVLKPLFGAEGRGIARLTDEALAWRAFKLLAGQGAVIYLQAFLEHEGYDLRLVVIGDEVLGMERANAHDWRTNISQGAMARPLVVEQRLCDLAMRAAAAVGAPFAGVDLLPGRDGQLYVLEVNAVPGWRALARTLDVDIAKKVLQFVCQQT